MTEKYALQIEIGDELGWIRLRDGNVFTTTSLLIAEKQRNNFNARSVKKCKIVEFTEGEA